MIPNRFPAPSHPTRPAFGAPPSSKVQDFTPYLPQSSDTERHYIRCQLVDTLAKDMSTDQQQQLVNTKTSQTSGSAHDDGSNQMDIVEVSVQLETLIYAKFPDSNSPNYKTLSKKVVQGLKTNQAQRSQLSHIKDQHEIEDFLQSYLSTRGRGPQQQESAGAASNQSNPFAFPRPGGPAGGAPRRPGPPNNRFPQQRFAVANVFQAPSSEQEQSNQSITPGKKSTEDPYQPQNNQQEESKTKQEEPVYNMAESGAADSSLGGTHEQQEIKKQPKATPPPATNQQFSEEFDFFDNLAQKAVQQQQYQQPHQQPHQQQFQHHGHGHQQRQTHPEPVQHFSQEHQQPEEQSRGSTEAQQFEEVKQNNQEEQVLNMNDEDEDRGINREEGKVFETNTEQEEGLQKTPSNPGQASQQQDQTLDKSEFQNISYERDERPMQVQSEHKPSKSSPQAYNEQDLTQIMMHQHYLQTEETLPKFEFDESNNLRRGTEANLPRTNTTLPPMHSQSYSDLHNTNQFKATPSVRGFIPIASSRPPQSVASVNITNLEDSEALIRAYKKKKSELDEVKSKFYEMETEFFITKQKNQHLQEENQQLRLQVTRTERQIKDIQMREQKNDTQLIQKQLQLKNNQIETYQKEIANQKSEVQKLRDRVKDLMSRGRQPTTTFEGQESGEAFNREREEHRLQISKYQLDLNNLSSELNDLKMVAHQRQTQEQTTLQQTEANYRKMLDTQKSKYEKDLQELNAQIAKLKEEATTLKVTPPRSDGERSFVNINKDSPEEDTDFGGYYKIEGSGSSSESKPVPQQQPQVQQQQPQYQSPSLHQSYFKQHDETDKQSSAPPSQAKPRQPEPPKPQVQVQPQQQRQQQQQQNQYGTISSKAFEEETSSFFDQLGKQPQQQNQQPYKPAGQQPQQMPHNFNAPTAQKPPLPQHANAYSFSLDDISFDQTPQQPVHTQAQQPPIRPPQQQPVRQPQQQPPVRQPQQQPPVRQPMQQPPVRPQQQVQQQRQPQQQVPQQQQRVQQQPQQQKPQNVYNFSIEDDDIQSTQVQHAASANVIPKSLFD